MRKIVIVAAATLAVLAAVLITFNLPKEKPNYSGITLKVSSSLDLRGGSFEEGARLFEEEYGCKVEFVDDFAESDLFYSSGEDFSHCQPIDEYVNLKNKLYTRKIIEQSCMQDGKIYGITNVLLGNLNYCIYNPAQYEGIPLPYERYKNGEWTWDGFIKMVDELDGNIAVDWGDSYINMRHALFWDENGKPTYNYGTQSQIEWLNFVRTLIFDDGIVNNREGAFKVDFLPSLVLNTVESNSPMRYIPWPTKDGGMGEMFVDEYHFCVPAGAQNPELSVELANYMIRACVETRTALYQSAMCAEDFKLLKKQLKSIYTYPPHTDYVPARIFIDDFVQGKTVTEHIYNVENGADHIE